MSDRYKCFMNDFTNSSRHCDSFRWQCLLSLLHMAVIGIYLVFFLCLFVFCFIRLLVCIFNPYAAKESENVNIDWKKKIFLFVYIFKETECLVRISRNICDAFTYFHNRNHLFRVCINCNTGMGTNFRHFVLISNV